MKEELFLGFKVVKKNNFSILKATRAKAFFVFLYLRKRLPTDKSTVRGLRLNLDEFTNKELKEVKGYVEIEGSPPTKETIN